MHPNAVPGSCVQGVGRSSLAQHREHSRYECEWAAWALPAHTTWFMPCFCGSCRPHDISVALQDLEMLHIFLKIWSSDSCCSHGSRIMVAFQKLSLYFYRHFLSPAQVVTVPFLFPESAFGTAYWRWTCKSVMSWKKIAQQMPCSKASRGLAWGWHCMTKGLSWLTFSIPLKIDPFQCWLCFSGRWGCATGLHYLWHFLSGACERQAGFHWVLWE